MSLIQLIVVLVVVGVALYLVQTIPMDQTIKTIIRVVVILAVILWLLEAFGLLSGGPILGHRRL
jgi:hypothetical protein